MTVPFVLCLATLVTYSGLDSRLPSNATYSNIEYAPSAEKLQALFNELTPGQYAVLGFSAGLHMLNAVAYAVTLILALCYISLNLRAAYPIVSKIADFFAWFQLLDMFIYFSQHSVIMSQLANEKAVNPLPQVTNALSITFLSILGIGIIYILVFFVVILVRYYKKVNDGIDEIYNSN